MNLEDRIEAARKKARLIVDDAYGMERREGPKRVPFTKLWIAQREAFRGRVEALVEEGVRKGFLYEPYDYDSRTIEVNFNDGEFEYSDTEREFLETEEEYEERIDEEVERVALDLIRDGRV